MNTIEKLEGRRLLSAVVGLSLNNELVQFDSGNPNRINEVERIRGLQPGERIVGIDYRPADGRLYAVGQTGTEGRIYRVNPDSGRTQFVADLNVPLLGGEFGVDFNPVVDRLRVVSDQDQNLRINPDTGMVADNDPNTPGIQTDGNLNYAAGDGNAARDPFVAGSAYTNNDANTGTATTLFGIDADADILVTQSPPNAGTLNTIGALGVDTGRYVGFDVETTTNGANNAFASLTAPGARSSSLYRIDLATGAATSLGTIGRSGNGSNSFSRGTKVITDIAVVPANAVGGAADDRRDVRKDERRNGGDGKSAWKEIDRGDRDADREDDER